MFLPFSAQAKQLELQQPSEARLGKCSELVKGIVKKEVKELPNFASQESTECYATCNALLTALPYPVQAKFAEGYALLLLNFLRSDPSTCLEYSQEVFPSLRAEGEYFSVNFFEFLAAEQDPTLQNVEKGKVTLDFEQLCVVLAESVRKKRLFFPAQELPQEMKKVAEEISAEVFAPPAPGSKAAYLSAPCIEKTKAGLGEGQRYYGSLALSIACHADGLNLADAKQVLSAYAKSCHGAGHSYTEREAHATLEWVYHRGISSFRSLRGTPFEQIHNKCTNCPVRLGVDKQRGLVI